MVEIDEPAPRAKQAKAENSSVSTSARVAATETAKVEKMARSENSSISLAIAKTAAAEKPEKAELAKEASAKPVDCKKFFPSVGMTVTVPCE